MNKPWKKIPLREILTLNYGKSLPEKSRIPGNIPVFGSNGIVGNHNTAIVNERGIIVGRKGSAGEVCFSQTPFCPIDTTFYITQPDTSLNIDFLYYLLKFLNLKRILGDVGVPGLNREMAYAEITNYPDDFLEQRNIAAVLFTIQQAIELQDSLINTTQELKNALMQKLFTEGLRGEAQKETEVGLVPESWNVDSIETVAVIKASAMSYAQLTNEDNVDNGVTIHGVKVSDMNIEGNEIFFKSSNLIRELDKAAIKRTVPPHSIIFPKRGAAIATNKKRIASEYTVLDPNLIALIPKDKVSYKYLYWWLETFDLRRITEPGPTPQLNKKNIAPILLPLPSICEQDEISGSIDEVQNKIELSQAKKKLLIELFNTLLHKLMTAEIRVNDLDISELEQASET